jgi:D-alanyl-D-alanine carboxypeptidase/D-alanyl-D-alanine-endopeptidase (penicillin-binding protein 4)
MLDRTARVTATLACALVVGAAGAVPARAQVPEVPGLPDAAVGIMNSAPYSGANWALRVADAHTGEVLVDYRSGSLLEPASVTKTFSSGAAWLTFGPDSRVITPVVRTGPVRSGVLRGDLVLVAKGDLTMGGQTAPDGTVVFTDLDHNDANLLPGATIADNNPLAGLDRLARQVKAAGIKEVGGDVVVDDRLWVTEDLGINDGPVSPIVINNNLIDIVASPTRAGQRASIRMRPEVAPWHVVNRTRTVAPGSRGGIDLEWDDTGRIIVTGRVPVDSQPLLKVVHFDDPATFARTAFIEALQRQGVAINADPVAANSTEGLPALRTVEGKPRVATLRGLPLAEEATYVLKVSYNRGAQTFVCRLAATAGSRDCDAGFPVMADVLRAAGVDPRGASLVDGSGLPGNFITAETGVALMRAFAARPDAERWKLAQPILGVDGSVAAVAADTPAKGHVYAKTGTLGDADLLNGRLRLEAKALSGYIDAKSGRQLAFTLMVNQGMFDDIQGVFAANNDLGHIAAEIWAAY